MEKQLINPAGVAPPSAQYTHLVSVSSKKLLFIAGQVAVDEKGDLVGKNDFKAQAEQAYKNLDAILKSQGATFKNVVKLNTYTTDIANNKSLGEVRRKFIPDEFPAATLVGVTGLADPDYMIEVEAVAALD